MRNRIEEFITENRKEFDRFEPREELWNKLDAKLAGHRKQKVSRFRIMSVAASVAVLMVASFLLVRYDHTPDRVPQVELPVEEQQAEMYYSSLIEVKRSEIDQHKKKNPELCKEFDKQIQALDILYDQLKTEYIKTPDKEVVISAMIENLQTQLKILSQQLEILDQIKNQSKKTKTYEGVTI
jgi:septal ring factor EnvC (AmiA/AmiB activator)